jgi:hypothetical protein
MDEVVEYITDSESLEELPISNETISQIQACLDSNDFENLVLLFKETFTTVNSVPDNIKSAILNAKQTSPLVRSLADWIKGHDTICKRFYVDNIRNDNVRFFWPFRTPHWKTHWCEGILFQCARWNQETETWDWNENCLQQSFSWDFVIQYVGIDALNSLPLLIPITADLAQFILRLIPDRLNKEFRKRIKLLCEIITIQYPSSLRVVWSPNSPFDDNKLYTLMLCLPIPVAARLYAVVSGHQSCTDEMHILGAEMYIYMGDQEIDDFCFEWLRNNVETYIKSDIMMTKPIRNDLDFEMFIHITDFSNYKLFCTAAFTFLKWMGIMKFKHKMSRFILVCISKTHPNWSLDFKDLWMPAVHNLLKLARFAHRIEDMNAQLEIPWDSLAIFASRVGNIVMAKEMWALNPNINVPDFLDMIFDAQIQEEHQRIQAQMSAEEATLQVTHFRLGTWECTVCAHLRKMFVINPCGHTFCEACVKRISRCPHCRIEIQTVLPLNLVH